MLYYLYHFKDAFSPLNVFQYITFRSAGAFFTGLVVALLTGPSIIRWLRSQKPHKIRADTPTQHQAKVGTPAMGGLIIYLAFSLSILLWARLTSPLVIVFWSTCTVLCMIGWLDDYLKAKVKRKDGLTSTTKMFLQIGWAFLVAGYLYYCPPNPTFATHISIPFTKEIILNLGLAYIPFSMLVLVGASNAVNLADGLDGLACGSLVVSALPYFVLAYVAGNARFSQYLRIIPVPGAGEIAIVIAALIGACLGFLWYNGHPAEVFMGDTGSLFLGGAIGITALLSKQELLLIIIGGIFVAEAMSVLIQVYSFRVHKRRIFKMAPLHHHFEMLGWPESKVTIRFWIVGIVLALIALSSLKLR